MEQDFSKLKVSKIEKQVAREIALANHYSHKWNDAFGTYCFGLFLNDLLLGVAVYGYPMNPKAWPNITKSDPKKCIELNRLWVDDSLKKNTESWFLSKTFSELKKEGFLLIQSFADGRLGVGTIYQATNFLYFGAHKTIFHETLNGQIIHNGMFDNTSWPKSMIRHNLLHAEGQVKTFEVYTYRYLLGLTNQAKKDIILKPKPYPKERFGMKQIQGYKPRPSQIARSVALASVLDNDTDKSKLFFYLKTLTSSAEEEMKKAFQNPKVNLLTQKKRAQEVLF